MEIETFKKVEVLTDNVLEKYKLSKQGGKENGEDFFLLINESGIEMLERWEQNYINMLANTLVKRLTNN
jgi:hypothetical protein